MDFWNNNPLIHKDNHEKGHQPKEAPASKNNTNNLNKDERTINPKASKIIFMVHLVVIIIILLLCFKIKLYVLAIVVALWALHLKVFDGCILTKWQRFYDNRPYDHTFFRELTYYATGLDEPDVWPIPILVISCILIASISTWKRHKAKYGSSNWRAFWKS